MNRKSLSPALPLDLAEPASAQGFTVWVYLARPTVAQVQVFRRGLDQYLESRGLTRSMNPLHMLVWSPARSLTAVDQVDLLVWLIEDFRARAVEISALQPHAGIPCDRHRVAVLPALLSNPALASISGLYKLERLHAEQVVKMLGGYRAPLTLH